MWDNAVTWLIALLAVAVAANWLDSPSARLLRRARTEAEVAQLLDEGPVRAELEAHVTRRMTKYLHAQNPTRRSIRTTRILQGLTIAMVPLLAILGSGTWPLWLEVTGISLAAVTLALGLWDSRRLLRQDG